MACFLTGKNPLKKNFSEKPLIDTAVETADAPGIGIIFISFLIHSFTKIDPGSEMLGVPASEIKEIISPDFKRLIILSKFLISLNLWFEINFDFISYLFNKFFEIRVSSHSINSDCFNISTALIVMSFKFPIGVETI